PRARAAWSDRRAAPLHDLRSGAARRRSRRGLPLQRPRRPGRARLRRRDGARGRRLQAGVGDLPRPPAAVPGGRPGDVQAAVRPPRRQPPGPRPRDRQSRDHIPEPRLRGARPGRRAHDRRRRPGPLGNGLRRSLALAREPVRPHRRGARAARRARGDRPVPPRGWARPARLALPVRPLPDQDRRSRLMPKRTDIEKIMILGSGPIVIGQAAEFDYSGVQACKVLREEGYEVVLVNSNPATIMTDPEFADATYVEPLLPGPVRQVLERERPDALLGTL